MASSTPRSQKNISSAFIARFFLLLFAAVVYFFQQGRAQEITNRQTISDLEHIVISSPSHGYISLIQPDQEGEKLGLIVWVSSIYPLTHAQIIRDTWFAPSESQRLVLNRSIDPIERIELSPTSWLLKFSFVPFSTFDQKRMGEHAKKEERIRVIATSEVGAREATFLMKSTADATVAQVVGDGKDAAEAAERGRGVPSAVVDSRSDGWHFPGFMGAISHTNLNKASDSNERIAGNGLFVHQSAEWSGGLPGGFLFLGRVYGSLADFSDSLNNYQDTTKNTLDDGQYSMIGIDSELSSSFKGIDLLLGAKVYYLTRGLSEGESKGNLQENLNFNGLEEKNNQWRILGGPGALYHPSDLLELKDGFNFQLGFSQFQRNQQKNVQPSNSDYITTATYKSILSGIGYTLSPLWFQGYYSSMSIEAEGKYLEAKKNELQTEIHYFQGYFDIQAAYSFDKTNYDEVRVGASESLNTSLQKISVSSTVKLSKFWRMMVGALGEVQTSNDADYGYTSTSIYLSFGWTG